MQHLLILGRQTELSLVELESVFGTEAVEPYGDHALLTQKPDLSQLGGTLKTAGVIAAGPWKGLENLGLDTLNLPWPETKANLGISFYGLATSAKKLEHYSLSIKKSLTKSHKVRLVLPQRGETALSAPQLKHNAIPGKGFEIIVAKSGNQVVIGLTSQVQDVDWYSKRDFGRPSRSAKVGMLPPKLAQIIINCAQGQKIYDPFCGTGVILQEALLLGKPARGSDIEPEMVEATRTNLAWLAEITGQDLPAWEVAAGDARQAKIEPGYTIASEGYLGPPLEKIPSAPELEKIRSKVNDLYRQTLANFAGQLTVGSRLCLCAPVWLNNDKVIFLPLIDELNKLGYTLVRFQTADSSRLIYQRTGQTVGRQLLVIERSG